MNDASEFEGGRTRFFGVDGSVEFEVTPKKGQALVYQHQLLHEGEKVNRSSFYFFYFFHFFNVSFDFISK